MTICRIAVEFFCTMAPCACTACGNGANRRTAKRYEREGLPFVMVAGRKYRPLGQGRAWLASRIKVRKRR